MAPSAVPVELLRFFLPPGPARPAAASDLDAAAPLPVSEPAALTVPAGSPAGAALTAPLSAAPETPAIA